MTTTLPTHAQVAELTGIIRELVRDAVGTSSVDAMLNIVHKVETHLYGAKSWGAVVRFSVKVGKAELRLLGGDIHACEQMTWDVYCCGVDLDTHPDYEHLGKSEYLTTPQMIQLLLKVAAI